MKKPVSLAILLLLGVFVSCIVAQTPPPPPPVAAPAGPCPKMELQAGANRIVRDGETIAFAVVLTGGEASVTPTFVWSTSAGMVKSGHGTKHIEIDSTGAGADRQIVVDLWIGGYPPECSLQASATVKVAGPAVKYEEFGDLAPDAESGRLSSFANTVAESPDNIHIIGYAGRSNVRLYASNSLKRIKEQLVKSGINVQRISTSDGGFRETPAFELWIVPVGATAPRATPTVDRKEIVYPKTTPAPVKKP